MLHNTTQYSSSSSSSSSFSTTQEQDQHSSIMYNIPFTTAAAATASSSSNRQQNNSNAKNKRKPLFPLRLYEMLQNAEKFGFDHIISWMPDGRSFKIHIDNTDGLPNTHQNNINKDYNGNGVAVRRRGEEAIVNVLRRSGFNQKRYKSFLRQLQLYGFERIYNGKRRGICRHDFLIRGRPDLVQNKSIEDFQNKNSVITNNTGDGNGGGASSNNSSSCGGNRNGNFVVVPESEQTPSELFLKTDNYNYWTPSFLSFSIPIININNTNGKLEREKEREIEKEETHKIELLPPSFFRAVSDDGNNNIINDDIFSISSLTNATACEG
jgi:hypothetical protein